MQYQRVSANMEKTIALIKESIPTKDNDNIVSLNGKTVYCVRWIEVEFGWGSRPEGCKIFTDREDCISSSRKSSANGPYEGGGGYYGPERPIEYQEIPFEALEPETQKLLIERLEKSEDGVARVFSKSNHWSPPKSAVICTGKILE